MGENLHRISYYFLIFSFLSFLIALNGQFLLEKTLAQESAACSSDLPTLTKRMLEDIPSYTNRVIQRSRSLERTRYLSTYVIVAGKPEFEPLPLNNRQYEPTQPDATKQIFFTTLERRYSNERAIETQNYHWLFLTKTEDGWRLVEVYTQLGSPDKNAPPVPPQENSNGAIGQAIQDWLRDCRAGAIEWEK
jgi:hypothetical protein